MKAYTMEDTLKPLIHPEFAYKAYSVGKEQTPLLVIDQFIKDPEQLIDFCVARAAFDNTDNFYPGLRMPAPQLYIHALNFYLGDLIAGVFGLQKDNWEGGRSLYSMIVTPPEQLSPQQCVPHVDSFHRSDLACVHFLCDANKGGTSLYRHKQTGFESLDAQRIDNYNQTVINEGALAVPQKSYMNGTNAFFERIAAIDAAFNRIVIYPTTALHSGNIAPDFNFDSNPTSGRLTLNSFIFSKRSSGI
jgi:hypothetical protein